MSSIKIEKLTKAQEKKLEVYQDEWIKIGLDTSPANRKEAEKGVKLAYKCAGLKQPKIVWCSSPLAMAYTRSIIQNFDEISKDINKKSLNIGASVKDSVGASVWASVRASVRASVWDSVWDSVWASVGDSVWDSVGASVWDSVKDSVGASVWDSVKDSVGDSVGASVWNSVRASVWDSVWDSVRASVKDSVRDSVWDSVRASVWDSVWNSVGASVRASVRASVKDSVGASGYGQHDAGWLSFYAYFNEVCGLKKETKKLQGLWQIAKNANWFLPHKNICWVSERPCELHRDERGRLHNLNSLALKYPDGWGIYSIHGVTVPEKYILTPADKIDPKEVLKESNAQVRMAVISKCGFAHFLNHLKYKTISKANGNSLLEFQLDNATVRGLHLKWKTKEKEKHETVIPVPRTKEQFEKTGDIPKNIDDCEQVRRWTMFTDITANIVAES